MNAAGQPIVAAEPTQQAASSKDAKKDSKKKD